MKFCEHPRKTIVTNQVNEPIAQVCDACLVRLLPPSVPIVQKPLLKECEWCGKDYVPSDTAKTKIRWVHKRFCGYECYDADLEDRRESGRELSRRGNNGFALTVFPERDNVRRDLSSTSEE